MSVKCCYCGIRIGNTKDHLLPKSFLKFAYMNDFEYNKALSCSHCNVSKGNLLIFPCKRNMHLFSNISDEHLYMFKRYLWENRITINNSIYDYTMTKYNSGSMNHSIYNKLFKNSEYTISDTEDLANYFCDTWWEFLEEYRSTYHPYMKSYRMMETKYISWFS